MPKFNSKIHLSNIFPSILIWEVKEKNTLFEIISTKPGQYLVKAVTMANFLNVLRVFSVLIVGSLSVKTFWEILDIRVLSEEDIRWEIIKEKRLRRINLPCKSLNYPLGRWNKVHTPPLPIPIEERAQ